MHRFQFRFNYTTITPFSPYPYKHLAYLINMYQVLKGLMFKVKDLIGDQYVEFMEMWTHHIEFTQEV